MNNLQDSNILSAEIIKAIDLIIHNCPDVVFGGSIALNAVGLLNRPIADIDLFFPEGQSLARNGFLSVQQMDKIMSDTVMNTNGKEIQRTGAKINNIKVCVFKVETEELQHSIFKFLGRSIRIQNVNYAIQAKLAYADKNPKHKVDLDNINKMFQSSFDKDDLPF